MAGQKGDEVTTWDMKVGERWENLTDSHKWIRSPSSFIKFVLVTSVALSYSPASFPRTMVLKHKKKIKKINETPFYSPLESCFFFCLFPLSCLTRARKWMMWGRLYRIPFLFLLFLEYIWPQHHRNNHHQAKKSILRSITVVSFYKMNQAMFIYKVTKMLYLMNDTFLIDVQYALLYSI